MRYFNLVPMLIATAVCIANEQSASGQAVIIQDDGTNRQVEYFSVPDVKSAREPDFLLSDLPLFTKFLLLSDAQEQMTRSAIEEYLARFKELQLKHLAPVGIGDPNAAMVAGEPGGPMVLMPMMQDDEQAEMERLHKLLPPGSEVGVDVRFGARVPAGGGNSERLDGQDDGPESPSAEVSVSINTPENEDISDDVRQAIQQHAQEMAAKLLAQMQQHMQGANEAGEAGGPPPVLPMPEGGMQQMRVRREAVLAAIEEFTKAKAQLRMEFVTKVQAALAEVQIELWPSLERALLRSRSIPRGKYAAERVDLLAIIDNLRFSDTTLSKLAELISSYETAMDAALRSRDQFLSDAQRKIDMAISQQKFDQALSLADRVRSLRHAVAQVNRSHVESMSAALDAQEAGVLMNGFQTAAYPSVFRSSNVHRAFEAALKLRGLDAETQAAVRTLAEAHAEERKALNDQIRATIDRVEPLDARKSIEDLQKIMSRGAEPHDVEMRDRAANPIRESFARRAELDDRYEKLLRELIGQEHSHALGPVTRRVKGPIVIESSS